MPGQKKDQRIRWRYVLVVIALAIVVNGALFAVTTAGKTSQVFTPLPAVNGGPFVAATGITGDRWASASINNTVVVWQEDAEVARAAFDTVVSGIAYLPQGQVLFVGTADGRIRGFDPQLRPLWTTDLSTGRVIALAAAGADKLIAVTGIGSYGNRFYVSVLDASGTVEHQSKIGRPVHVAGATNSLALLGTQLASVTTVDLQGQPQWESLLQRDVSVLYGGDEAVGVLAGDIAGNAYLLNGQTGEIMWPTAISGWKITAALPANSQILAYGDEQGAVNLLSNTGEKLMASNATQDRVVALVPMTEGQALAFYRSGQRLKIDVSAFQTASRLEQIRSWGIVADVLLGCLLLGSLVLAIPSWRRKAGWILHELKSSWLAYLFILPSLVGTFIFFFYPAGQAVFYSLTNYRPGNPLTFVGPANYVEILFRDPFFWRGVRNMILLLVSGVIKVLTLPLFAALLVYHLRNTWAQYWVRTTMLIPSVVPALITVMMWKMLYAPGDMGFINLVLDALGLEGLQTAWLGDSRTALGAVIFAGFPWVDAFALLVYLGGLINMNRELIDAAAIDGADWWRRLRHIEWPLLAPQRNLLVFFAILAGIQEFAAVYVFTGGGPAFATMVPALQMYLRLFRNMEIGYASALGLLLMASVLVMTFLQRRLQQDENAV